VLYFPTEAEVKKAKKIRVGIAPSKGLAACAKWRWAGAVLDTLALEPDAWLFQQFLNPRRDNELHEDFGSWAWAVKMAWFTHINKTYLLQADSADGVTRVLDYMAARV
jgi:hypothetical protein